MITIKAPIELKVRSDLAKGYDAFGEKIAGNYALMGLEIGEEELLHMVSSPPEIYLMDEGSTTVGGNTFISGRNEEKYSIVNNMLNRIMLSVNGELTYQDRTYITETLHKLGIRDDRKFMTEVRKMIDESHLEENFLNHYFELVLGGENRELRQRTLELSKELVQKETYHTERSREDFLSESILHRLQTGAIYQIVSNFNKSLSDTRIELQESMLSEQENVARKLLVQNFLFNVVKEEPELFHVETGSAGGKAEPGQVIREVSERSTERIGEGIRDSRTFEQSEREFRRSEELRSERESAFRSERETAEIIFREGETAEQVVTPGMTEERVIIERTRESEPGTAEYRTTERIRTEQDRTAPGVQRTDEGEIPAEKERVYSVEKPGERLTDRVTEESTLVTERSDRDHSLERTEQYRTEREELLRAERERAELIFREGENREKLEETILDRLAEQSTTERERVSESHDTELFGTERVESLQEQVLRTEQVSSETIRQEEREFSEEIIPGTATERVTTEGERVTEQLRTEQTFDHTDRYVTEQGEILRTEHEGTELIYREERTAAATEEDEMGLPSETVRETGVYETERIREAGEPVVSEQRIPTPGEQIIREQSRTLEGQRDEYHTRDRLTTEQASVIRAERERIEQLLTAGTESPEQEAQMRDRLQELLTLERSIERTRTERETGTERTERYVTEAGEILRTEHEGAELIYREESAAAAPEEGEMTSPTGTLRERETIETERIRETGEPLISEQRIPGTPGERVTDVRRSETLQDRTESRLTESLTRERESVIRAERERIEQLLTEGTESPEQEAQMRNRLQELLTMERSIERTRTERETGTERIERYVTEAGEILRTEHEGAELIYREESAASASEEGEMTSPTETFRERSTIVTERIPETGETIISGQRIPGTPGERVTDVRRSETLQDRSETRMTESFSREQERVIRAERERIEQLLSTGMESPVQEAEMRDRLKELLTLERSFERTREERETGTERTERYVTEAGEILRTEHEGAELIYREGEAVEQEGSEAVTPGGIHEIRESERERVRETERLEKERSSVATREEAISDIRSEIKEKLDTERIRTEQLRTEYEQGIGSGREQADLVYREGTVSEGAETPEGQGTERIRENRELEKERLSERDRLERERRSYISEKTEVSVRDELREQIREQLRTERSVAEGAPEPGRVYDRSELIYREKEAAGEERLPEEAERRARDIERYRSDNIFERELLERESSKTEVTAGLASAVLLDVVKTMFHAGYDKIGKGDTWIEYRGALYHSAENVFDRLNYNLDQRSESQYNTYSDVSLDFGTDFTSFQELQEITENKSDVQTIEETIREMNEMNLQNVERYEQMVQVLKTLQPEKKRKTGGIRQTRQEALNLLDDEQSLYEKLQHAENAQEEERREVFHEITRIFPEHSVEIFKVVEQYLDGSGQPKGVGVSRNNVEEAAEEIRRITSMPQVIPEPVPEPMEMESSELIYRRNDRMTQEELQEMFETIRRSDNLQRREVEQKNQQFETDRRNTTTFTTNTERTLTRQDAEDIEALVSRGVRSQMSAISEQVLQKLEKKLRNEKIRRGI
ncbi:MAG: hypothetical protein IKQ49_05450 [Eubacterium sp.]|nr:hypothetical protein [Eubacterium sp.]